MVCPQTPSFFMNTLWFLGNQDNENHNFPRGLSRRIIQGSLNMNLSSITFLVSVKVRPFENHQPKLFSVNFFGAFITLWVFSFSIHFHIRLIETGLKYSPYGFLLIHIDYLLLYEKSVENSSTPICFWTEHPFLWFLFASLLPYSLFHCELFQDKKNPKDLKIH